MNVCCKLVAVVEENGEMESWWHVLVTIFMCCLVRVGWGAGEVKDMFYLFSFQLYCDIIDITLNRCMIYSMMISYVYIAKLLPQQG